MQRCIYADSIKCETCTHVFYMQCEKFVKYHNTLLVRELLPFKFERIEVPEKDVYISTDENKLKSAAALYSIHKNKKIKYYTYNQIIGITLSDEEYNFEVVFADTTPKIYSKDQEKIGSVFASFVDKCIVRGIKVFILKGTSIVADKNWYKL